MTEIPITRAKLAQQFQALGVAAGQVVMLHASAKSVGSVMGGPNVILQALLDVLTPAGTLMMYAGWEDIPDFVHELPADLRQLYLENHPPFDPALARSVRDHGILVEFLRTFPGTQRSVNPEASMVALGAHALQLTQNHALNYGYGLESPLARLVQLGGKVLLLGTSLDTVTLLHHAEFRARLRHKNIIHYTCPIIQEGRSVWVEIEDYNTGEPHDDYTFEAIVADYLAHGNGQQGKIGTATSFLLDAASLTAFAVHWLETRFGSDNLGQAQ